MSEQSKMREEFDDQAKILYDLFRAAPIPALVNGALGKAAFFSRDAQIAQAKQMLERTYSAGIAAQAPEKPWLDGEPIFLCDACADHHSERCDNPYTCEDYRDLVNRLASAAEKEKRLREALEAMVEEFGKASFGKEVWERATGVLAGEPQE